MKRLLAIAMVSIFVTSCGNGNERQSNVGETASSAAATDSTTRATDSTRQTGDTSALNRPLGDSTSSSGSHGQGSGSRVGGGKTGSPQQKNGH